LTSFAISVDAQANPPSLPTTRRNTLRNVQKLASDDQWLKSLPTENLLRLKLDSRLRSLVSQTEIETLCDASLEVSENGRAVPDHVLLMACSGVRRNDALRLKWSAVNWQAEQLTIGADGLEKGREIHKVDLNAKLKEHSPAKSKRRVPDSENFTLRSVKTQAIEGLHI